MFYLNSSFSNYVNSFEFIFWCVFISTYSSFTEYKVLSTKMKFSNYHWRILYMFCECCKQELMSVCLFVFMGSWMSGVTLLHNLIWPADDGELFITLSPRCVVFLLWIWYISNYVNDVSDRIIWFPPGGVWKI